MPHSLCAESFNMSSKWYSCVTLVLLCGAFHCHTTQDAGYCGDCITDPNEPCNEDHQCTYIEGQPYCNASSQRCEKCDCDQDEGLSWCHAESGGCVQCLTDGHCSAVANKPMCRDNVCVQCTPQTEESDCGDTSCNPATFECTDTTRDSVTICSPCISDSECQGDDRYCVPMQFSPEGEEVTELGGFCLQEKPTDTACSANPYTTHISRTTLSGIESKAFCGVAEPLTTCKAVLDLIGSAQPQTCANNDECGVEGLDDGVCDTPNVGGCTYACNSNSQCPADKPCPGGAGSYCGKP